MKQATQLLALTLIMILMTGCVTPSNAGEPPDNGDPIENPVNPGAPDPDPEDPEPEEPDPEEPDPGDEPGPDDREGVSITFLAEHGDVRNPERGFHTNAWLVDGTFELTPDRRYSLVRSYVRLDDWRERDLPGHLLDRLEHGLELARTHGVKVILRFSYNFGPDDGDGLDAPIHWVERHIEQLTPILRENSDVITVLQAGFIGRWGEWHNSTNNLVSDANRERVTRALLEALPESRMIQLRSPWHMKVTFPHVFTPEEAFTGNLQSRVGFKNDCFLAGVDDIGTYDRDDPESDRIYAAALGAYTAVGGETCSNEYDTAPSRERRACDNALDELARFGWDYLNLKFYYEVLETWQTQGCFDEIEARLGYRFELRSVTFDGEALLPGEDLTLRLEIGNTGFGKLYNPRPLQIVLRHGLSGRIVRLTAVEDARVALPLAGEETTLTLSGTLPEPLETGTWQAFIALPDAAAALRDDSRYAIRLLGRLPDGEPVWSDSSGGLNILGCTVTVQHAD